MMNHHLPSLIRILFILLPSIQKSALCLCVTQIGATNETVQTAHGSDCKAHTFYSSITDAPALQTQHVYSALKK